MTKRENSDLKFNILMWLVVIIGMVVALIFCVKKQGYHFDENYSYYSTNITAGLNVWSREWKGQSDIKNEFVIVDDDSLNLGLVKLNQSFDVHPPLYYYCLRLVSYFTQNTFSKWQGLSINLFFYFICLILLWRIADVIGKGNKYIDLFTVLLFALSPGYLSTVTFIRMYVMLTAICFGILLVNMVAMRDGRWDFAHVYIPTAVLTFAGFLTHYYFMIFVFFLAAYVCIYLVINKETRIKAFIYGGSVCVAMAAAVLYYPACLSHIFSGYRGKEATAAFTDVSNTWGRLNFFIQILNDYTFSGMFYILVLVILLLYMFQSYSRKVKKAKPAHGATAEAPSISEHTKAVNGLFVFVTVCYFLLVSKTGMMPSNPPEALRYECPAYGLIILLVVWGLVKVFEGFSSRIYIPLAILAVTTVFQIRGLCSDKVFFIYEEARDEVQWAKEHQDGKVVFIYNPNNEWMIWNNSSELMEYDGIYFLSMDDTDAIDDELLTGADRLYVYSCRSDNTETILGNLVDAGSKLNEYEQVGERLYADIYVVK